VNLPERELRHYPAYRSFRSESQSISNARLE
jgi:hypothetical protein